jgi:hypothetical protein
LYLVQWKASVKINVPINAVTFFPSFLIIQRPIQVCVLPSYGDRLPRMMVILCHCPPILLPYVCL